LILGASQFFAGAFLATDPPSRRSVRGQLIGWNVGTALLALAVPIGSDTLADLAVALLVVALALYGAGLLGLRRASLSSAPWATRWYGFGGACLGLGVIAGAMLARPVLWPHGDLLAAHMALNLAGWFGAAIVGTLHTFYPSLTRTELRFPRLQAPTFAGWVGGVALLVGGYGWRLDALAVGGWVLLSAAALLLCANIAASALVSRRPLSLPARLVGIAQIFLPVGLIVAATAAAADGPSLALAGSTRAAVGTLLVAGWVGLTVLGSLLHLLAVVVRVRDLTRALPAPRPRRDLAIVIAATAGVAGLVIAQGDALGVLRIPALVALLCSYALLGAMIVALGARVLVSARPRI
jgi:nitrite reductase (NO-forming)